MWSRGRARVEGAVRWIALGLAFAACSGMHGAAWRRLESGRDELLVSVFFTDTRTGFAVGGDREEGTAAILIRTSDGGASWQTCPTGLRTRLYGIHFPTHQTGYAVGLRGSLLKTVDGGKRWTRLATGTDAWLAAVFFTSKDTGFVVGGGADTGVLLRTDSGGRSWRSCLGVVPETCRSTSFRDVSFVDRETGYVVGERGVILKTVDGGDSWTACESGADVWLRALHLVDAQRAYVAGSAGVLLRTENAGASWERVRLDRSEKLNDVRFVDRTT
ncbi:MAG: WD40/YVTN/BNR-like repeat-containing protein, partial [Planctomycetota bacterium]